MTEQLSSLAMQEVQVRPIIADVSATMVGGRVEFDLEWRKEGDPSGKKGAIEIGQGDSATPIHFHLRDGTNLNLGFKSDADQAMWVNTTGCPPAEAGNGGQISFGSSSKNLLKVTDANSGDECELFYMLRFDGDPHVDPDGKQHPPFEFDPIIRNGGGGGGGI